jgi:hypothetical protein
MRSDGPGRALACALGALTCGYLGLSVASFLGPFLFLSSPESDGAGNSTALLACCSLSCVDLAASYFAED